MKWEKIIISVFILIVLTSLSLAKEKLTVDDPFQDENVTEQEIINETFPVEEIIPEEETITEEELIPEFSFIDYVIDDANFNETGMINFRVDYSYSNLNITDINYNFTIDNGIINEGNLTENGFVEINDINLSNGGTYEFNFTLNNGHELDGLIVLDLDCNGFYYFGECYTDINPVELIMPEEEQYNTKSFIYGKGKLLAESYNGKINYIHGDNIGSSLIYTDENGNKIFGTNYLPFGKELNNYATINSKFKFTGKNYDADNGLNYFNARYYNPNTGSFVSNDPMFKTEDGGYQYVNNNPLIITDPSGETVRAVNEKDGLPFKYGDDIKINEIIANFKNSPGLKNKELMKRFIAVDNYKQDVIIFYPDNFDEIARKYGKGDDLDPDGPKITIALTFKLKDKDKVLVVLSKEKIEILEKIGWLDENRKNGIIGGHELLGHGYDFINPGRFTTSDEFEASADRIQMRYSGYNVFAITQDDFNNYVTELNNKVTQDYFDALEKRTKELERGNRVRMQYDFSKMDKEILKNLK